MASQARQPLPRLSILPPLNMQQPFDNRQALFSPALQTSIPQNYHPPLQTPMQPFFHPQPPSAPPRPSYTHHKAHASIAHYPNFPGPSAFPITPLGHVFPPQIMPPPFGHPFIPRNRRAPSLSISGPPKAPLGGPGRKLSPLPLPSPVNPPKSKKIVVSLPMETVLGDDGTPTRPPWARNPMPTRDSEEPVVVYPEIDTGEMYPPDALRRAVPDIVDVFLPGKVAWDAMTQRVIEEKLEKLGVERGGNSSLLMHAPHARAASISSPADPSLLYFKLNELRRSQNTTLSNSLSSSPQPPFNLSPSPSSQPPPCHQNRHGHSLSLAHPPAIYPTYYSPTAAFNPFGPSAVLGSDSIEAGMPIELPPSLGLHAPQGRIPPVLPLAPAISRGSSRPDFVRGFGLDIPEEEEPPEEPVVVQDTVKEEENAMRLDSRGEAELNLPTTMTHGIQHSRHASKLSHTLSLRSVGGVRNGVTPGQVDIVPVRSLMGNPGIDDLDQEVVGEWTGSEDLRMDESDDEGSTGEWSNPSDEERARQQRAQRRFLRQGQQEIETPRRLPNFPAPPRNVFGAPLPNEYDVVSNPSEEGLYTARQISFMGVDALDFALRPSSTSTPGQRALLPLAHSRGTSGQFTSHDPALAHSRCGSDHAQVQQPSALTSQSGLAALNPHAKPFVFGADHGSNSWSLDTATPPPAPTLGHARLPSVGKPLNATAQEFKPTGFAFRPIPGVPRITLPPQEPVTRPLSIPPVRPSPRAQQGREKRRRRGSSSPTEDGSSSGKENLASFRFPAIGETPRSIRRSAPTSPRVGSQDLHAPLQALTFSGFPTLPLPSTDEPDPFNAGAVNIEDTNVQESKEDGHGDNAIPLATSSKSRRAPIPLDFKNPATSNTVPAGLFKALVSDEKTRRTVRSRLGSRDILDHSRRPSLDDFTIPAISSQSRSRTHLVPDPGLRSDIPQSPDIFTPAAKRRSSLPALHSGQNSTLSNVSIPAINLTKRLEAQALEDKIEAMLEEKFTALRAELNENRRSTTGPSVSSATEEAMTEVVALFRTQLQESAARGLDDSQIDARGELDLDLIRDVIQQGHADNLLLVQTELRQAISQLEKARQSAPPNGEVVDQPSHAVQAALNDFARELELRTRPFADKHERNTLIEEIRSALIPALNGVRPEPIDYNLLTAQLSEAVKPNIEQLIDLAADKRETAGLIVNSILPLLPNIPHPNADSDIVAQISAEVRRAIAPIDAHEIKEQVADLVVERLDSRLAVRDRTFNMDILNKSLSGFLQSISDALPQPDKLVELQSTWADLAAKQNAVATFIPSLPGQYEELKGMVESVKDVISMLASNSGNEEAAVVLRRLESAIENVTTGHLSMNQQHIELFSLQKSLHQELTDRISALPETLSAAVSAMQTAHAEFAISREAAKLDADEIKKLKVANNDLQIQVAKARGAHGQVRVEKDNLAERLRDVESERERLRAQNEDLQNLMTNHQNETATVELRISDLEQALSQSLARLKSSDVATQAQQERIAELEKANRDATADLHGLESELHGAKLQAQMAAQERDLVSKSLKVVRQDYEQALARQSLWDDDLRRNMEQIETLTNLLRQADEERQELRRVRDQCRQLESEQATLQRRLGEQEQKTANSERLSNAAKQSHLQAQQRAAEWERLAKQYECDLKKTRNDLEQAEQASNQFETEYSLAKLQLEEKDAKDRLIQDREHKLRDQVFELESQVARLEAELSKVKAQSQTIVSGRSIFTKPMMPGPSKDTSPPRPDSRASITTTYGSRSRTPGVQANSKPRRHDTPSQSSVWDSMHAPMYRHGLQGQGYVHGHSGRSIRGYTTPSIASPTPSTVSLTPTVGPDGWYQ